MSVWFLPLLIVGTTILLSIPVGMYLAWIMDGRYRAPAVLRWLEERLNTGPQKWQQYTLSLLLFNTVMFIFGFLPLPATDSAVATIVQACTDFSPTPSLAGQVAHDAAVQPQWHDMSPPAG